MFGTFKTRITGANARAEEQVRDVYAIELIDQKIREAEGSVKSAKATLASLIQRQRSEERQKGALEARIADMTIRATEALDADREDLAAEAASAIAQMENELKIRNETVDRLDQKVILLRSSLEADTRRIIDLKQGAIQACAVRREQQMQKRINSTIGITSSVEEAEDLSASVLGRDDPFEQSQILDEIDNDLGRGSVADRMAASGFGPSTRTTADDVLARLKSKKK
ncbi:PspA/IM30 family protein [Thalassobium sp. R2A62]|uniref:PspA/IM30 family protein n=1 Tax=Thalassobium sp. R2A62 TaxID=633131 RepID=UPI0001B1D835|nr:PspA/IM30 family protein [Thalassobium sp. R2A62]EET48803.1 phage shock protein A, PspA [Thalassobium sp. R2A62]